MPPQSDLTRLEGYRQSERNIAIVCANCGHRGVLHGPSLWRVFAIHRWDDTLPAIGAHMRCSVCKRRPTAFEPSSDPPTLTPFPKDEPAWQRMVRRARD